MLRLLLVALLTASAAADEFQGLLRKAQRDHWLPRWEAVEELARTPPGRLLPLLQDPRAPVRETVAWACAVEPRHGEPTLLARQLLREKEARVRRPLARALVHHRDRRGVAALIEALSRETDRRTGLHIVWSLRRLTGASCGTSPDCWRRWWKRQSADPEYLPPGPRARRKRVGGVDFETRSVAGKALRILVLPQYDWTTGTFDPYLLPLLDHATITWVRLPPVKEVIGRRGFGSDVGVFPVKKLVAALEAFRRETGTRRFVLVADRAPGWVAMRYALTHPKHCAGLILVDTALDRRAVAASNRWAQKRGDANERWLAAALDRLTGAGATPALHRRIAIRGMETGFDDRADLEIGWHMTRAAEPEGFALLPQMEWKENRRLNVPILFLYSGASAFSGHRHADRVRHHFPKAMVVPLQHATGMPYVEHNQAFHRAVGVFLKRYGLVE